MFPCPICHHDITDLDALKRARDYINATIKAKETLLCPKHDVLFLGVTCPICSKEKQEDVMPDPPGWCPTHPGEWYADCPSCVAYKDLNTKEKVEYVVRTRAYNKQVFTEYPPAKEALIEFDGMGYHVELVKRTTTNGEVTEEVMA